MKFLDHPPRFLFFTGKGGVGKTSIACATAIIPPLLAIFFGTVAVGIMIIGFLFNLVG